MKAERQHKEPQQAAPIQSKQEKAKLSFVDNKPQTASQTKLVQSIQKKENKTGLPNDLKLGIENLSGYSMDDVRVHYNSGKPAQLNALAYAQGMDIHVASGQEKYLPHEAWHVVQQMQGRVQPTMQLQEMSINDNEGLENEADIMGEMLNSKINKESRLSSSKSPIQNKTIQLMKLPEAIDLFQKKYAIRSTSTERGLNGAAFAVVPKKYLSMLDNFKFDEQISTKEFFDEILATCEFMVKYTQIHNSNGVFTILNPNGFGLEGTYGNSLRIIGEISGGRIIYQGEETRKYQPDDLLKVIISQIPELRKLTPDEQGLPKRIEIDETATSSIDELAEKIYSEHFAAKELLEFDALITFISELGYNNADEIAEKIVDEYGML